eukprot:CAMPEP_0172514130 /NCGR_PEP_ID=MMETSP1066-20121228/257608_1 /TAXON_ID=671091 /ORGANISM="Coscinodiscus wailesii, Strain CCMP2513" /LENGTH=243 /DNA_ID=CAMNT_0013294665 /DNA_START=235 /DNA_END=963 /DNA_ORIENTATION=+
MENANDIIAGISLPEIGIDLAIAPSKIAPQQMGLYLSLSPDVDSVALPALTLICGYSRTGTFHQNDVGDRTVGFSFSSSSIDDTGVFYERQLMSIRDALEMAAEMKGVEFGEVELAGHVLVQLDEGRVELYPAVEYENDGGGFARHFVPDLVNKGLARSATSDSGDDNEESPSFGNDNELSVQNFGQFCNDLAWSYTNPPQSATEYEKLSEKKNVVQLIWRLELDDENNVLKPSWPVSVTSKQ